MKRTRLTPADLARRARTKRAWVVHRLLVSLGFIPVAWETPDQQIHVERQGEDEAVLVTHVGADDAEEIPTKDLRGAIARMRAQMEQER